MSGKTDQGLKDEADTLLAGMDDVSSQFNDDPSPTYRGFRHQSLYVLKRILEAHEGEVFHPEGIEDLAVYSAEGVLVEIVQVKSYTSDLTQSSLGEPFYHRAATYVQREDRVPITIVSYGPIGLALSSAVVDKSVPHREKMSSYVNRFVGSDDVATRIVENLRIECVREDDMYLRTTEKLSSLCTGVDPARAFDLLWWWIYEAAENKTHLCCDDVVKKITSIGLFLAERTAFHDEWFTVIKPLEDVCISPERRVELAEEFASGVGARFEHIASGLDVPRGTLIDRIHCGFNESNVTVIHGASGQGKTALAYRYCHDYYPGTWRYVVDLIESPAHALKIALALNGHVRASDAHVLVFIDVRPGDTSWVELARALEGASNIQVLVAIREEDWRRSFGSLAELSHRDIELTLDEAEAERIYTRMQSIDDIPHVLNFRDAWVKFGESGPLLEYVYFLRNNDTLEARLKSQVTRLQDAERKGDLQPQELDLLRLVSVATAYEARVDVRNLSVAVGIKEPLRIIEAFEKEYFLRLTSDKKHVVALHPIRAVLLTKFFTDEAISPWSDAAKRVLPIIEEYDLERFLLNAFLHRPECRSDLMEAMSAFHPSTWTGVCGCSRAILWLGVREYINKNQDLITDVFARCNQAWHLLLNFDIAGVSDFNSAELFSSLGEMGDAPAKAAQVFAARQTDPKQVFERFIKFMGSRSCPISVPTTSHDWRSLGEVFFWLGHLNVESPVAELLSEDLLSALLYEPDIESVGDACAGVYTLWGDRYVSWYKSRRVALLAKMRVALCIVSFKEKRKRIDAVFLVSREEIDLLTGDATAVTGEAEVSLNNLIVSKLNVVRNILPFKEQYACKGVGLPMGMNSSYDESVKDIPKKNLLLRWGPELNHLFSQLAEFDFRPASWAEFSEEVLRIRGEVLQLLMELRDGILAHYQSKEPIHIKNEYLSVDRWNDLKANNYRVAFLPKCAVDEWGMALEADRKPLRAKGATKNKECQKAAKGYGDVARGCVGTMDNFLSQSPDVLVRNAVLGKASGKGEREQLSTKLKNVGIAPKGNNLSMVNLADFCKSLPPFQREISKVLMEKTDEEERKKLDSRERCEIPSFLLLWDEFLHRPNFVSDAAARQFQIHRLSGLDATDLLSTFRKKLQRDLAQISRDGIEFRLIDTDACWDSKPTLWIACDVSDLARLIDASKTLERCLHQSLCSCRSDDAHRFVLDYFWQQIVAVPLAKGKSFRKMSYPYFGGAVHVSPESKNTEFRHMLVPIPEDVWSRTGLVQWQSPNMFEFQEFADSISRLWEMCGYFSGFVRLEKKLDDMGGSIVQSNIEEHQDHLGALLEDVLGRFAVICDRVDDFSEDEMLGNPIKIGLVTLLSSLQGKLFSNENGTGSASLNQKEMGAWSKRLDEATGIVGLAEILWSADVLDLQCDLDRLEQLLNG